MPSSGECFGSGVGIIHMVENDALKSNHVIKMTMMMIDIIIGETPKGASLWQLASIK